jgi:ribosome-interacting GTPase 1
MPANLTPEYYAAEEEYRNSMTGEERLRALAKMLSVIPKNKATQTVIGEIRRKMSILKKEMALEARKKRAFAKKGFKKEGAAQVCLVGPPNTGKSYILNKLCNKKIKSTELPFETTEPEVGMMDYDGVQIQLVEIPSTYPGFYEKRGDLQGIIHTCDLVCFVVNSDEELDRKSVV